MVGFAKKCHFSSLFSIPEKKGGSPLTLYHFSVVYSSCAGAFPPSASIIAFIFWYVRSFASHRLRST